MVKPSAGRIATSASSILNSPSELTPAQRAEHDARVRREWEERFVARIADALLFEPALAVRIVTELGRAMQRDDRLAARVRKALPKRDANGRPASSNARRALQMFRTNFELYEQVAPGRRGNRARAVRDVAAATGFDPKSVERLVAESHTRKK